MRDEFIDEILTSLKIIGSIKEGQKVCVRNGLLTLEQTSTGIQASVKRWLFGDNRATTLHYIRNVVHNALSVAKMNADNAAEIVNSMESVIIGLGRLEVTYTSDVALCSAIQVLSNRIMTELKKLNTNDIDE